MTQPYKICPQCQQPAELTTQLCSKCGRQYRTQFAPPIDQTQVVNPLQPPTPSPTQQFGVHRNALPSYGPGDRAEWTASCFWFWVWLWFSSSLSVAALLVFIHSFPEATNQAHNMLFGGAIVSVFAFGTWATFCAMRLRRLYVYFAPDQRPWRPYGFLVMLLVAVNSYGFHRLMWPPAPPEPAANNQQTNTQTESSYPYPQSEPSEAEVGGAFERHEREVGSVRYGGVTSSHYRSRSNVVRPRVQPSIPTFRTFRTSSPGDTAAPPAQPIIIDRNPQSSPNNSLPGAGGFQPFSGSHKGNAGGGSFPGGGGFSGRR